AARGIGTSPARMLTTLMRFKETDVAISGSAVISFTSMRERIWECANGTSGTTFVSARDTPPLLHATCLPRAEMFMRNWAFSQGGSNESEGARAGTQGRRD